MWIVLKWVEVQLGCLGGMKEIMGIVGPAQREYLSVGKILL